MKQWLASIATVVMLGVLVGVPMVIGLRTPGTAQVDATASTSDAMRLVIVSPHNEQIRYEFERAFNAARVRSGLPAVVFDWRAWGGTSELVRGIKSAFEAEARRVASTREPMGGIGYDLFFGGGAFEHDSLARGLTVTVNSQSAQIRILEPVKLSPQRLLEVYPQAQIGGEPLYHKEMLWVGTALSSFGIVYNRDVLQTLGLPEPHTWEDLVDAEKGRYRGWVVLADPALSGSIAVTYETILRRLGWSEGWRVLRRIFANARYFAASASTVPVDVSAGEAAAGMCIDFYGRYQAGAVAGDRVRYIAPAYMTSITADPVAILHGAPHPELAQAFAQWLLSPQAQTLWQKRIGAQGGPEKYELRRLPVRRDVYTQDEMAAWTDQVNPFDIAKPFPSGMPSFFYLVTPVVHAMAIDVQPELQAAWEAVLSHPDHLRRAEMLKLLDAMPPDLALTWPDAELAGDWAIILEQPDHPRHEEAAGVLRAFVSRTTDPWRSDPDRRYEDQLRWTLFFRGNYRRVVEMADE